MRSPAQRLPRLPTVSLTASAAPWLAAEASPRPRPSSSAGLLPSCLRPNAPSLFYSFTVLDALGLLCCTGAFSSRRVRTDLGEVCGFSSRRLFLLQSMGSRHAGFSSYGPRALLPRGMWDLLRAGVEPVSPTPVGGFLATGSPGKSLISSS